uniref:Uncharacterized protein n=1 Tax=viral metagenome TaxID=1070528 RepID=A0A6C0KNG8_9ZZZZ
MSDTDSKQVNLESTEKSHVEIKLDDIGVVLTEEQQQIVQHVYQSAKNATESMLHHSNVDTTLVITQMIGQVVKILEYVKINDKKISGSNKKAVALHVGRLLIKEVVQEEGMRQKLVMVYDAVADQTLEVLIDVSHVVNTKVKDVASSCYSWICGI